METHGFTFWTHVSVIQNICTCIIKCGIQNAFQVSMAKLWKLTRIICCWVELKTRFIKLLLHYFRQPFRFMFNLLKNWFHHEISTLARTSRFGSRRWSLWFSGNSGPSDRTPLGRRKYKFLFAQKHGFRVETGRLKKLLFLNF